MNEHELRPPYDMSLDPANTQRCLVDISADLDGGSMISVKGGNCEQLKNTYVKKYS